MWTIQGLELKWICEFDVWTSTMAQPLLHLRIEYRKGERKDIFLADFVPSWWLCTVQPVAQRPYCPDGHRHVGTATDS